MEIKVQKLSRKELEERGVFFFFLWEKEVSRFDWFYDSTEECYVLEGSVEVKTKGCAAVAFGKGDFVTFLKRLACFWDIRHAIRKHYHFK